MKFHEIRKKNQVRIIIILLFAGFGLNGCSDNGSDANIITDNLVLGHFTSSDISIADNSILTLDTVKMLIKDIKFGIYLSDDSLIFHMGPYLVNLSFNPVVFTLTSSVFPDGIFDKMKFEIHKPDSNETISDPEFTDIYGRYSIVTKGSFNGNRFTFKLSNSVKQNLQIQHPFTISSTEITYITLRFKPYVWFLKNGDFLDPRIPGNAIDITNNIKNTFNQSITAFKDNDRNGIPD